MKLTDEMVGRNFVVRCSKNGVVKDGCTVGELLKVIQEGGLFEYSDGSLYVELEEWVICEAVFKDKDEPRIFDNVWTLGNILASVLAFAVIGTLIALGIFLSR